MSYYHKFILVVILFVNTSYIARADEGQAPLLQGRGEQGVQGRLSDLRRLPRPLHKYAEYL